MQHLIDKVEDLFGGGHEGGEAHSHTHHGSQCITAHLEEHNNNRYQSFAPQTAGNAKWYVDGCSYFWAVSEALEKAQRTIYILDWWLSPELYLRRPPAQNEQYRLDNMLKAAAERGVQIRVIVYKEVPQALTLNSAHTKHHLEDLHSNIRVFRHPDHMPSGHDIGEDLQSALKSLSLGALGLSKLRKDTLKTIYGTSKDDVVLYWAHHEKLCVIDDEIAFMGGLDMCFGRWDTNSHPIADAHPEDLNSIIFPGQDYNNARVYDFEDVDKWENNKLDRTVFSRMGWSDISLSLAGPIVASLLTHFTDRWNFIYNQKYVDRKEGYHPIDAAAQPHSVPDSVYGQGQQWIDSGYQFAGGLGRQFQQGINNLMGGGGGGGGFFGGEGGSGANEDLHIQLTRSCTSWSSGLPTEHSIANAYIAAIHSAEHFIYMENQFFITATSDEQKPVANKVGRAIVDRIVRAHQAGEDFGMIVCIPAVPGFAGDLHSDGALGTRAIMEYQYNSISRGGYSIYEELQKAGVEDPTRYLRFYNLRNYDRINAAPKLMGAAEEASGVPYEEARREFDDAVESGYDGYSREDTEGRFGDKYNRYQAATEGTRGGDLDRNTADSVAACYMANGPRLDDCSAAFASDQEAELKAYVSEELYIHSKVMVVDDRFVLCGSANMNDRSQLGTHDSEIAVTIEDPGHPVNTTMAGQSYVANAFAASLRRQLFRKHLGLLSHQPCDQPNNNFLPVTAAPNDYDWDSEADRLVADPLSEEFRELWTGTARTNTAAFDDVFHCVPTDKVRSWDDYKTYFSEYFVIPGTKEAEKTEEKAEEEQEKKEEDLDPTNDHEKPDDVLPDGKTHYGHVVPDFAGGVQEVKRRLGEVRGTLVEMPLQFLVDVKNLAKEGLTLNGLTDDLYT